MNTDKIKKTSNNYDDEDFDPGEYNAPYISPTPGRIPIIAQDPMPGSILELFMPEVLGADGPDNQKIAVDYYKPILEEIARSAQEAGFNVLLHGSSFPIMDGMIDAGAKYGLKSILSAAWLRDNADHVLYFMKHYNEEKEGSKPSGYNIMDEPNYNDWGDAFHNQYKLDNNNNETDEIEVPSRWNDLTLGMRVAQSESPDVISYFNLSDPEDGEDIKNIDPKEYRKVQHNLHTVIGSCSDYEQYLDIMQKLYRPGLWSYDVYPFRVANMKGFDWSNPKTNPPENTETLYYHFFKGLEFFHQQAEKTNRPFLAYCLCEGHGGNGKFQPTPTIGMLRFEAFSALVYGAQGIVYWQYGKGKTGLNDKGSYVFEDAPLSVDETSDLTAVRDEKIGLNLVPLSKIKLNYADKELWQNVKQVNEEIQSCANVFLNCRVSKIVHIWQLISPPNNGPAIGLETYYGVTIEEALIGEGILISTLTRLSYKYVVIVNHSPYYEGRVILRLSVGNYTIIQPGRENWSILVEMDKPKEISVELDAGGCVIIRK